MSKFIIQGGKKLAGKIRVAANKNAVLPIMAAAILTEQEVVLENVPQIKDVDVMSQILQDLGARVERTDRTLVLNAKHISKTTIDPKLATRLRASVLFIGPLLARTGKIKLLHPGGDIIGRRGIETHLQGLQDLGVKVEIDDLLYKIQVRRKKGGAIFLADRSVTATENLMMYAAQTEEETVIENAASEPHVVDLANFLNKLGPAVSGAGTNKIRVLGKNKLGAAQHMLTPDFIEAGTFAITAALTGGKLEITPIIEDDMRMLGLILSKLGIRLKIDKNTLRVDADKIKAPKGTIQAAPWPGFPTDLMSPFIVLATQAEGQTLCHDPMYESRMFFVDKLINMGAKITICDPHRVIVYGQTKLNGRRLASPDIRAGMALVIAALIAEGESIIDNAEIVERGYENLEQRLKKVGAEIKKVQ